MQRVPVIDYEGKPLMPTKASRARRWLRDGKAWVYPNDLGIFAIQWVAPASGNETQDLVAGIDPGKSYSGIGVQSAKATHFKAHVILPFSRVKRRMETRALLRRARRGRRVGKAMPFEHRAHREKWFDNHHQEKLPPSIRANRQLELRIVQELQQLFPLTAVVAASHFMAYRSVQDTRSHGHVWTGTVQPTDCPFVIIQRPPLYRRHLHFENPRCGAARKRKGGMVTPWGLRSGDLVQGETAGETVRGWMGGYTEQTQRVSIYDAGWKRLGQFALANVSLLQRSTGLCVTATT